MKFSHSKRDALGVLFALIVGFSIGACTARGEDKLDANAEKSVTLKGQDGVVTQEFADTDAPESGFTEPEPAKDAVAEQDPTEKMPIEAESAKQKIAEEEQAGQDKEKRPAEQDKEKQAGQDMVKKFLATLEKEGVELDRKKKTVTVPVVVNAPTNDLEFLLIHPIGKSHEALLLCRSKPSVLRAGLTAIGLKIGKNAHFKKKVPAPTEKELEAGADPFVLVPPEGQNVYMTVSYKKKDGKIVTMPVEDLLLDWAVNLSVTNNRWVFLGGRKAELYRGEGEVFMADYEGNLISTCYKYPTNHLLTIVHERARDEMNWSVAPACPPPGTEMSLTFHANKPDVVTKREARMKKEAEGRKREGDKVDTAGRPDRNPAREGQGAPPKVELPPKKPPKKPPGKPLEKKGEQKKDEQKQGGK